MTTWTIDPAHSEIHFKVRHMMISNVRGHFEDFTGTVEFDPDNPEDTRVEVQIDANSINTREEKRDAHLRSADFLDAETYPYLEFVSRRVEAQDEDLARLIGDLTIRGETHEVALDVSYSGMAKAPWGSTSAGFSATTTINRKNWNLTWNQALETGGVLVGDEIQINLELEIIKQEESEAVTA